MNPEPAEPKKFYQQTSFIIAGLVVFAFLVNWATQPSEEENRQQAKLETQVKQGQSEQAIEAAKESARQHDLLTSYSKDLSIVKESWKKGGFGSVALHSFGIKNTSKTNYYKDVTVRFYYTAQSGTELAQHDQTVYKSFPPNKTIRISDLNAGLINNQVYSSRSEIVGATNLEADTQ